MINEDTICAIATPLGGALAVVRVSGPSAISLVDNVFTPKGKASLAKAKANTLHYGVFHTLDGTEIDDVVVSLWRTPHSYTGEDAVEISCHGSAFIAHNIIQTLIEAGCRQADHGEFTMRAFLNGKMDLSQAEAVADLIAANNKASHDLALSQMKGYFSNELKQLHDHLLKLTSLLELELDFSDHEDLEFADRTELRNLAEYIDSRITQLADSFKNGQAIKEGIPVAIVKFRIIDTAGIRQTEDKIERIGIERSYDAIARAAVVVWVIDEKPTSDEEADLRKHLQRLDDDGNVVDGASAELIIVHNKCDLHPAPLCDGELPVSAKNGTNLNQLVQRIYEAAHLPEIDDSAIIVTNARHYQALVRAHSSLSRFLEGMTAGLPSDLLAEDLRLCLSDLGEITGQISPEMTLKNIFSRFCIGK